MIYIKITSKDLCFPIKMLTEQIDRKDKDKLVVARVWVVNYFAILLLERYKMSN